MKKISVLALLAVAAVIFGCAHGSRDAAIAPAAPEKNRSVFIEMVYDPALLITYNEQQAVIEDLQSRIHSMGYGLATVQDRADIILKITIEELRLVSRNKRLMARTTFGLGGSEAYMTYSASFIDNRTFDELAVTKGRVENTRFRPSFEQLKASFFSQMEDEITTFMASSTAL